jgi:hypothetical protein
MTNPDSARRLIGVPLVYLRRGFPTCVMTLRADGTIADGPGHAEARWSWDGESLVLHDDKGAAIGRLDLQDDTYVGTILNRVEVALRAFEWPLGYRFGTTLGKRLQAIQRSEPMRYLLGMPFVNRRDLLERAIASVPAMQRRLVVIDNSTYRELRGHKPIGDELIYEPPVPLTFVQSMNLLQQMAHEANCDVLCFMHNDAEAEPGMDHRFLDEVTEIWRRDPEFGVLFTAYDTLAAFNMMAVRRVGPWDSIFTQYFADVEYYARLRRHGFKEMKSDIGVIHHTSMTIKTDPRLEQANAVLFPAYQRIFHELCQ